MTTAQNSPPLLTNSLFCWETQLLSNNRLICKAVPLLVGKVTSGQTTDTGFYIEIDGTVQATERSGRWKVFTLFCTQSTYTPRHIVKEFQEHLFSLNIPTQKLIHLYSIHTTTLTIYFWDFVLYWLVTALQSLVMKYSNSWCRFYGCTFASNQNVFCIIWPFQSSSTLTF